MVVLAPIRDMNCFSLRLILWSLIFRVLIGEDTCWSTFGNYQFRVYPSDGGKVFDDAVTLCESINTTLASIHSLEEDNFLEDFVMTQMSVPLWIGLRRRDDTLTWVDGTKMDFVYPRYKRKTYTESCIYMFQGWIDGNCKGAELYFICKREVTSKGSCLTTTVQPPATTTKYVTTTSPTTTKTTRTTPTTKTTSTIQITTKEPTTTIPSTKLTTTQSHEQTSAITSAKQEPSTSANTVPTTTTTRTTANEPTSKTATTPVTRLTTTPSPGETSATTSAKQEPSTGANTVPTTTKFPTTTPNNERTTVLSTQPSTININTDKQTTAYQKTTNSKLQDDSTTKYLPKPTTSIPLTSSERGNSHSTTEQTILPTTSKGKIESIATERNILHTTTQREITFEELLDEMTMKEKPVYATREGKNSRAIGSVSVLILFGIILGVVLLDLATIKRHLHMFKKNIRGVCRRHKNSTVDLGMIDMSLNGNGNNKRY